MKTVLVTGASGLIGSHTLPRLAIRGYNVHAISRMDRASSDTVHWHAVDLLDTAAVARLIDTVRPTHLLHMAWIMDHGVFWTAPENVAWLVASLELLEHFGRSGGGRAVGLGTCAEYDWSSPSPFHEMLTPLRPRHLYGAAKSSLGLMQSQISRYFHFQQAWCRPFFLYGPGENASRLVPSLAISLLRGEEPVCRDVKAIRDFLHLDDMAEAIAMVVDNDYDGTVNIASGQGVELGELANILISLSECSTAVPHAGPAAEVSSVVADVSVLTSLGFRPTHSLKSGLAETLEWWRSQMSVAEGGPITMET